MRILFEGLDLAGKSTVCRIVRDAIGGDCLIRHNSLLADNPVYELANRLRLTSGADSACLGFLYYAALRYDLQHHREDHRDIIQDSTILLRSLAYHRAHGTPHLPSLLEEARPLHPRFDAAFVCVVSRETREARLALRREENLGPEDFIFQKRPAVFAKMEEALRECAGAWFGAVTLRTDGDLRNDAGRVESLVEEIRCHLRSKGLGVM